MSDPSPTYADKLRAIADTFERQDRELGRPYALMQLKTMLNATSNEALHEYQTLREETPL